MAFAHLHVHTTYSICDGVARIGELFRRAKELGQPGLAITDHEVLSGVPTFLSVAKAYPSIKPVIGCEIYLTDHCDHKIKDYGHRRLFHLTLLAKNLTGYRNLIKIVTASHLEGIFLGKPRVSHEFLAANHDGLIALSGCFAGEIPRAILNDDMDKAEAAIRWCQEVFGDDFYLEVMAHNWSKPGKGHNLRERQDKVNAAIFGLAEKYNVDVVATNDVHFVMKEDAALQDAVLAEYLFEGEQYSPLCTGEEYLKSEQEMLALFPEHPEVVSNTMKVLDKVERYSIECPPEVPDFPVPEGCSQDEFLRRLCEDALEQKECSDTAHRGRLENELKMAAETGFANLFLILRDLVWTCKGNGKILIPGSRNMVSSLINYLLGIVESDPVESNLPERFQSNREYRYPEIRFMVHKEDLQFVVSYLRHKYGWQHMAETLRYIGPSWKEAAEIVEKFNLPLDRQYDLFKTRYSVQERKGSILLGKKPMSEYVPLSSFGSDNDMVSQYSCSNLLDISVGPVLFNFVPTD